MDSTATRQRPAAASAPDLPRARRGAAAGREAILASRDRFWKPDQLTGASSTVQHLLTDFTQRGELMRVRKGLYWRGRQTVLGMSPPSVDRLVAEVASGAGVGPAGFSAANLLRLSTQVPRRAEIAVPRYAPRDAGAVRFVSRHGRTGRQAARLTPTEVAFLEVLASWDRVVELPHDEAAARLRRMLVEGQISAKRLARAAATETSPTRARLARLLADAGEGSLAARVRRAHPIGAWSTIAQTASADQ
jgi:hypothetical protein